MKYELLPDRDVVLAIDVQRAFGEVIPVPSAKRAVANICRLLGAWRAAGGKVILTQHAYENEGEVGRLADFMPGVFDLLRVGSPHAELYDGVAAAEDEVIRKTRFSAALDTPLLGHLSALGVKTVVVVGLTTPICDQATVDSLSMSGFQVVVVEDACASQPLGSMSAAEAHRAAIERMGFLLAEVTSTHELIERAMTEARTASALS